VAADGALWVTGTGEDGAGRLRKLDPNRLRITTNVTVGSNPAGVAYGAGSLWVANSGDGTVMRINPATGQIVATIHVGGTPYDLAFSHGLAWVTIL
jgi:YVTN family beta-propeller protein